MLRPGQLLSGQPVDGRVEGSIPGTSDTGSILGPGPSRTQPVDVLVQSMYDRE